MSDERVPSLFSIALTTLKRYKGLLGNIGGTPIELIYPVLEILSAEELKTVENETIAALARTREEFIQYTWPLWYRHCQSGLVGRLTYDIPTSDIPSLPGESLAPFNIIDINVPPKDYRWLYDYRLQQLEEIRLKAAQKLKLRADEAKELKKSREIQVIDVQIRKKGSRRAISTKPQPSARERLGKKLGLASINQQKQKPKVGLVSETNKIRAPKKLPTRSALLGNQQQQQQKRPGIDTSSSVGGKQQNSTVVTAKKAQQSVLIEDDLFCRRR